MKPIIGWTQISRDALSKAENHLRSEELGVRDEIGFLSLHQAYSNRFFPGTSVLHTRLRYILFVPWIYERLLEEALRGRQTMSLTDMETSLIPRLLKNDEEGIIGKRTYPNSVAQPPSMVYWSALSAWGILKTKADNSFPSRWEIDRKIRKLSARTVLKLQDDNDFPLEEQTHFFVELPKPPDEWRTHTTPLDFKITKREGIFLKRHLIALKKTNKDNESCLFAKLVENDLPIAGIDCCWHQKIIRIADGSDKKALVRARNLSSLTAIGRGIYAAFVEELREKDNINPTGNFNRNRLQEIIHKYQADSICVDLDSLTDDISALPDYFMNVLEATRKWIDGKKISKKKLLDVYSVAEETRKGKRARLSPTLSGLQLRQEWEPEKHPEPTPLHYRWNNVRQLLFDLRNA